MLFKHLFRASAYGLIMFIELMTLFAVLAALLLGVLMFRPEWIINEKNIRTTSLYLLPRFDIELGFDTFQAQFPKTSIYERGIDLNVQNLRFRMNGTTFLAPKFAFSAGFDFHPKHFGPKQLGPLLVEKGTFALDLPPADPYEIQKPLEWDEKFFTKIREIRWDRFSLDFIEVKITQDKKVLLHGPLNFTLNNDQRTWKAKFSSGLLEGTPLKESSVNVDIKLPQNIEESFPINVKIAGKAKLEKDEPIKLDGSINIKSLKDLSYKLAGSYDPALGLLSGRVHGFFKDGRFLTEISAEVSEFIPNVPDLILRSCRLEGRYNLDGPVLLDSKNRCEIYLKRTRLEEELAFADLSPDEITVKIDAPLKIQLKDKLTYLTASTVSASILPIRNDVYHLSAAVKGNFAGYLSNSIDSIKSEIKVDSKLEIAEFKNLVARLEDTDFAIPAPFHTLQGRVQCGTQGKIVNFGQQTDIPLQCMTDLKSSVQALAMDVKGSLQTWLHRKPKLKLDILFQDVAFELPQIRIEDPIPQFTPDPRLQNELADAPGKALKDQVLPIELDLAIKTEKSAKLKTHVLKGEPVPIDVDIKVTGDKAELAGIVEIKDYDVNFMKRRAKVDHVTIRLKPQESPELDGLFVFKETDFRIDLILKGSADRPFYYLESDPPRSPTQLLSMLMFGGEPDGLDTEGQRSVEETRAAMVDGALGLLSMYYLASTPIDSVGYNPYTKVFRARVKLAKGLTLAVGSELGGSHQTVGIRKRLSENWSFETTAENDEETSEKKGVALFKWGRRY